MSSAVRQPAAPYGRVERFETIVIGAGQAGLAVGYYLDELDLDFVIVDGAATIGESWRSRWDSLRVFTPAKYNSLPGLPFPAPSSHLPDKDEVADYLAHYAERFDLPVRLSTPVRRLGHDGERFVLQADDRTLEADQVVVATGPFQRPNVPPIAQRFSPGILQLHSSVYRNPLDLPDGPVLVVGAGNSGAQIALELSRFHKVWLSGRSTGALPRRLLGRDLFDWIWPLLMQSSTDSLIGRRARARRGADPRIGIPERRLTQAGVVRLGRVDGERGGLPVCGGELVEPRTLVWCTGFAPDYRWIDLPVRDDAGMPRHRYGIATDVHGLYFAGLRFQRTAGSALIGGVAGDAQFVARAVEQHAAAMAPLREVS